LGEGPFPLIEPQVGFARIRVGTVTGEATVREEGSNIALEVDRLGGAKRRCESESKNRGGDTRSTPKLVSNHPSCRSHERSATSDVHFVSSSPPALDGPGRDARARVCKPVGARPGRRCVSKLLPVGRVCDLFGRARPGRTIDDPAGLPVRATITIPNAKRSRECQFARARRRGGGHTIPYGRDSAKRGRRFHAGECLERPSFLGPFARFAAAFESFEATSSLFGSRS